VPSSVRGSPQFVITLAKDFAHTGSGPSEARGGNENFSEAVLTKGELLRGKSRVQAPPGSSLTAREGIDESNL